MEISRVSVVLVFTAQTNSCMWYASTFRARVINEHLSDSRDCDRSWFYTCTIVHNHVVLLGVYVSLNRLASLSEHIQVNSTDTSVLLLEHYIWSKTSGHRVVLQMDTDVQTLAGNCVRVKVIREVECSIKDIEWNEEVFPKDPRIRTSCSAGYNLTISTCVVPNCCCESSIVGLVVRQYVLIEHEVLPLKPCLVHCLLVVSW